VKTFEGQGQIISELTVDNVNYFIHLEKGCKLSPVVPLEVKAIYLRDKMSSEFVEPHLKDEDYYKKSMGAYSAWSYEIHVRQVREILQSVPSGWTVVAPADGIGIVARAWKGKYIGGDSATSVYTDKSVVLEDLSRTVLRGLKEEGPKIFIFSYCWEWVPAEIRSLMRSEGSPYFVLQPTDTLSYIDRLTEFSHYGPGLFGCRVPVEWVFSMHSHERFKPVDTVLFSENLLVNPGFRVVSDSDYLKYYLAMQPLSPINIVGTAHLQNLVLNPSTSESFPWLATTIEEFLMIRAQRKTDRIYFAPCGAYLDQPIPTPLAKVMRSGAFVLPMRQILVTEFDEAFRLSLKDRLPCVVVRDKAYFFCSIPSVQGYQVNVNYQYGMVKGLIRFVAPASYSHVIPYVKVEGMTILIADSERTMALCKCSLKTPADYARVIGWWYSSSSPPKSFLRDLQTFGSGKCECEILSWSATSPQELLQKAQGSQLKLRPAHVTHCKVYDANCILCQKILHSPVSVLFSCGHQKDFICTTLDQKIADAGESLFLQKHRPKEARLQEAGHLSNLYSPKGPVLVTLEAMLLDAEFDGADKQRIGEMIAQVKRRMSVDAT